MHKICAREVKTTGMETAGNQWAEQILEKDS